MNWGMIVVGLLISWAQPVFAAPDHQVQVFSLDFDNESGLIDPKSARFAPMREPSPYPIFDFSSGNLALITDSVGGAANFAPLAKLDQIPIDRNAEAGRLTLAVKQFIAGIYTMGRLHGWPYSQIADDRRNGFTQLMIQILDYLEAQKEVAPTTAELLRDFQLVHSLPNYILLLNGVLEGYSWNNIDPSYLERWRKTPVPTVLVPAKTETSLKEKVIQSNFFGEILLALDATINPNDLALIQTDILKTQRLPNQEFNSIKDEVLDRLKARLVANGGGVIFNYRVALYQDSRDPKRVTYVVSVPVYLVKPDRVYALADLLRGVEKEMPAIAAAQGVSIRALYDEYQAGEPKRDAGWDRSFQRLIHCPKVGGSRFDEDF